MKTSDWTYYNHAFIPTTAPHKVPDITPITNKSIWKEAKGIPLLARWTTKFDCGYETEWWWIIKDTPYCIDELSSTTRKHIRQSQKKCYVKIIDPELYRNELWKVFDSAFIRYKNSTNHIKEQEFKAGLHKIQGIDYWGGFDRENDELIGYMICAEYEDYVITHISKYNPFHMNKRVSDAIHNSVLQYYLNEKHKKYVCSGERSIHHDTNVQDYKINNFKFKKAYCWLNLKYRFPFGLLVNLLMPFRKIIYRCNMGILSKIKGVLFMEEICRRQEKMKVKG